MPAFTLRARIVVPIDHPPIENGMVVVDGPRIAAVGPFVEGTAGTLDLGEVALVPGFVNAHSHLEFSGHARPLGEPGMRLVDWIRLVIAQRSQRRDSTENPIERGIAESLASGTTALADIATGPIDPYSRATCPELAVLAEVIAFSRARAESVLGSVTQRLDDLEAAFRQTPDAAARLSYGISPHAPYTVSPRLVQELTALAQRRNLPVAMHLAESREELELLNFGTGPFQELLEERSMWDAEAIPKGTAPLDYLRILSQAPRSLVIHGNFLGEPEHAFLAAHAGRMSLVHCPRTHAYFEHPPFPLYELISRGVRISLGTDSRASNPDLSMVREMRAVFERHPAIRPEEILRMATLDGAEALGWAPRIGTLTPGKLANLVALPLPARRSGTAELLAGVLDEANEPVAVWLRGEMVAPSIAHH